MKRTLKTRRGYRIERLEHRRVLAAPVLNDDTFTIESDFEVRLDVLANDSDPDGDTLSILDIAEPTGGTSGVLDDGRISYLPFGGFLGTDAFQYWVTDNNGESASATITVRVLSNANTPPVANHDSFFVETGGSIFIDLLANDSDPDGDNLSIINVNPPADGVFQENGDGTGTYTPNIGATGADTFSYIISDGNGGTDSGSVTVVIQPRRPVNANPDVAQTDQGIAILIPVLENDSGTEQDPLTIIGFSSDPLGGTATIEQAQIFYSPNDGYSGTDEFNYIVSDGNGTTATAAVTVTVVGDGPSVTDILINNGLLDPPDRQLGPQPTSWAQQRSDIRRITVQFDKPIVAIDPLNDMMLTNLGVNAPLEDDFTIDLMNPDVVTITTAGDQIIMDFEPLALQDGVYDLVLRGSIQSVSGSLMNQDVQITGDRENTLYKLVADWNGDQGVNIFDFQPLAYWFPLSVPEAPAYVDCNNDGGVSAFDVPCLAANFGRGLIFPSDPARPTLPQPTAPIVAAAAVIQPLAEAETLPQAEQIIERLDYDMRPIDAARRDTQATRKPLDSDAEDEKNDLLADL